MPDADGNPTNPERCERAYRTLLCYDAVVDRETALADLLADLRHLCDQAGYDWDYALSTAFLNYNAESTGIEP